VETMFDSKVKYMEDVNNVYVIALNFNGYGFSGSTICCVVL